jgi:hypothetical protein
VQPPGDREAEQRMPGRVELDLVAPPTGAVEGLEDGGMAVGLPAPVLDLLAAEPPAERRQVVLGPGRPLSPDGLHQHPVAREEVVTDQRWYLIDHFVGHLVKDRPLGAPRQSTPGRPNEKCRLAAGPR